MRILLTNDDGIARLAPGAHRPRPVDDIWIVRAGIRAVGGQPGPDPVGPDPRAPHRSRRFAVEGTPTDCVMMAVQQLIDGPAPDLVLSGVNRGQNLAEDVTLSGTVAGAIEGMALGIRSIALSQAMTYFHDEVVAHWETAEHIGPGIVQKLLEIGWPKDVIMNVNFPALPPNRSPRSKSPARASATRTCGAWKSGPTCAVATITGPASSVKPSTPAEGTDLKAVYEGKISVTPLHIDLTHNRRRGDEGRAGRRASQAGGGVVMATAKVDTPEARLPR
jgi:5'-nucleotidase